MIPVLGPFVLSVFSWDAIASPDYVGAGNHRSIAGDRAVLTSVALLPAFVVYLAGQRFLVTGITTGAGDT